MVGLAWGSCTFVPCSLHVLWRRTGCDLQVDPNLWLCLVHGTGLQGTKPGIAERIRRLRRRAFGFCPKSPLVSRTRKVHITDSCSAATRASWWVSWAASDGWRKQICSWWWFRKVVVFGWFLSCPSACTAAVCLPSMLGNHLKTKDSEGELELEYKNRFVS